MSIAEKKRGDAAWEDCVAFVSSYCPHHSNRESRTGSDVVITRISCPTQHWSNQGATSGGALISVMSLTISFDLLI